MDLIQQKLSMISNSIQNKFQNNMLFFLIKFETKAK